MITTTIIVFTPLMLIFTSENGKISPTLTNQKAYAIDVGILELQKLDASFNSVTGELVLNINGVTLATVGSTQQFVYQLPEELKLILTHPHFSDYAKIDYRCTLLLGLFPIEGTIPGSSLKVDSLDGTVIGASGLALSIGSPVSAMLRINLYQLGFSSLPPSQDGKLDFYAMAAKGNAGLIDIKLELLTNHDTYDYIDTGVDDNIAPDPPVLNSVTDVDEVVTGKGEIGATVHIVTPSNSYTGIVDTLGTYSVAIPAQDAGTVITASQTDTAGNVSGTSTTVVIGTKLDFTVPTEIRFKSTSIGFHEVTVPREIPSMSVKVYDTRGNESKWKIKARAVEPLTSTDGETLDPTALIFVKADQVKYLKDETLIYDGVTGQDRETIITWNENEGILIKLIPSEVHPGVEYSTTINWTIEKAP